MNKLNFILKKNEQYIINQKNINYLNYNNKIEFYFDGFKYTYMDKVLYKDGKNELIKLDFNNKKCLISLKNNNYELFLSINLTKFVEEDNFIEIIYAIESEENVENKVIIECIKNS